MFRLTGMEYSCIYILGSRSPLLVQELFMAIPIAKFDLCHQQEDADNAVCNCSN